MIDIRGWDRLKLFERNKGLASYIERFVRKIVNIEVRKYCASLDEEALSRNDNIDDRIIVSITTFPERIDYVELAVKSLLHQTIKPAKIVLWLAEKQFVGMKLPKSLTDLCKYGLEIRYCNDDLLAHKKYYYSMLEYPDKAIITYDDDLIYPEDSIEKLLKQYELHHDCIICNRGREIMVNGNTIGNYEYWEVSGNIDAGEPSYRLMASTGAGTLYPPHCMPKETFDISKIKEIAFTADDLWMKAMSIVAGIKVVRTQKRNKALCVSVPKQETTLAKENVLLKKNDEIFRKLLDTYPVISERLIRENQE